jgi:Family of unknown function (DUF6152)
MMREKEVPSGISGWNRSRHQAAPQDRAVGAGVWRDSVRMKLVTIFLGLLTVSFPLFAHHGAAAYDTAKKITAKGTVTEWFWANPHCFLRFDAKDDKGNVVHWATEASNPADMVNLGWSKQSFKPGDEITVTFTPVRNGQPIGRVEQVVLADGQILKARVIF